MHRTSLPKDTGMLFIFQEEEERSFWMKNTLIPLSTAFITTEGLILNILDMFPQGNVADWELESYRSKGLAKYVLEMDLGWFRENGIRAGDRVLFPNSVLSVVPEW